MSVNGFAATCVLAPILVLAALSVASSSSASQIDIDGPPSSAAFGSRVKALANGNFVIVDSLYGANDTRIGAVFLHGPGRGLISVLTGTQQDDRIGSDGITALPDGNFVVRSSEWGNGGASGAGAITWIDGSVGLSGAISVANSLVGRQTGDHVGNGAIVVLANGNVVVGSYSWNSETATDVGAITWMDGHVGRTGLVSATNSLIGSSANETLGFAGSVTALANGNYVVANGRWTQPEGRGAVMLANGRAGAAGYFAETNSLVGKTAGDHAGSGGIVALANGNYVVRTPNWSNGDQSGAGAVTWADGTKGLIDNISATNSLVGSFVLDHVGSDLDPHGVIALRNGNYVVASPSWSNGPINFVGAVTWGDGSRGVAGPVSSGNSLVGTNANDWVGSGSLVALANGNYVVGSGHWRNGESIAAGAVTWGAGDAGIAGFVSPANSLVGSSGNDQVGSKVRALGNGHYVVNSSRWHDGVSHFGAITWGDGNTGTVGPVSTGNSMVGDGSGPIGTWGAIALTNGNYFFGSPFWNNGAANQTGAVTWGDGRAPLVGVVASENSLTGTTAGDQIGSDYAAALANGNFVVASSNWSDEGASSVGAVTWCNGRIGLVGPVSSGNSLVGVTAGDRIGSGFVHDAGYTVYRNSTYVIASPHFTNGAATEAGAVSLIRGDGGTTCHVSADNSVLGEVAGGGETMTFDYDPGNDTLIVGQPAANRVSLFKADLLFRNSFQ